MDEEQYFQQFDMSGMTPDQQELFKTVMWGAATYTPGVVNNATGEEEGERPLSSYSSDVQNLIRDYRFQDLFKQASNEQYAKILRDAGISSEEWFANNPEGEDETPYTLKVLRAANYDGINESESFYSNPKNIASEEDRDKALENLREEAMNSFESSYLFPVLGGRLNEIVPEEIKNSPEKMRDFELAFKGQFGIGLDFDESGRIGDLYTDNVFGNAFRQGVKYPVTRLAAAVQKTALDYGVAIVDMLRGDEGLSQEARDLKFRVSQQEGKDETYLESEGKSATSPSLFYASLFSPEARRQLLETSAPPDRTRDIEQLLENPSEVGIINGIGIAVDMLIDSAPLIAEIGMSMTGAGAILKGGTKAIAKGAAKKAAKETLYDPVTIARTGVLKDAAAAAEKARKIQSRAAALNAAINKTGGFLLADVLVASHVHADNSSEDWYQNLDGSERAWFLANQSSAEVASGMVLGGILGGNGIISKASQALFKGQKKAINSFARSVVESTFFGIAEEGVTEGITAGWQYFSEIEARKNGGDSTAIFDQREFIKRVKDGALAGTLMGGVAGFGGGLVKGAAKSAMSKFHPEVQKLKKELDEAAQAMDNAVTEEQKTQAKESLQDIVSKYAGAQSAVVRAYVKLAEANPEIFEEIARIQGMINAEAAKYRNGNYNSNEKSNARKRVKRLVEKKNDLQNKTISESTAEGLADFNSFDDLVNSEAEAVAKERGSKLKQWKKSPLTTASEQTTALLKEENEAMSASLEAAQAVNSQEQNADDDVQDQEGQTQEDAQAKREAAEDNSLEGDADNQFASNIDDEADIDDRVKSKYRDVIETVNNLMKGFNKFGIKVVLHKTSESYFKATGKEGRGVFTRNKSTKTIHMDLEKMALGEESNLEGVYNTPVHEFLHLAFTTADVATLRQYKKELLALARSVGKEKAAQEIFKAVEDSYKGESDADILNEQITNALERLINMLPEASKPGFLQRCLRAFLRVFGLEKAIMGELITPTDFLNFIKEFKQARDEGAEFKREEIPLDPTADATTDMESRDVGMRQPSKAYPDLINKRVSWTYQFPNKYGNIYTYAGEKIFNDYWHFRNWWIKETGNGKAAEYMFGFRYMDNNGVAKDINPPKPKIDRETGELVDMEPILKHPDRKKIERNKRTIDTKARVASRSRLGVGFGKALNMMAGFLKPSGFEVTDQLYFDSNMYRVEQPSEMSVVYSERFFIDGFNPSELEQLGNDFQDSLDFVIPVEQEADLAFTVRNNGDGTVTIDAHSDAKINVDPQSLSEGDSFSGVVQMESRDVKLLPKNKKQTLFDIIGRSLESIKLSEFQGMRVVMAFYDPTSGERSGIGADYPKGYLFSQSEEESAEKTFQRVEEAAIQNNRKLIKEAEKFGKSSKEYKNIIEAIKFVDKDGNVTYRGRILLTTGFMSEGSLIGNKDFIGESFDLYRDYYQKLVDIFGEDKAQSIFVKSFNAFLSKGLSASQKTLISNISSSFDLYKKEGFTSVRISELPGKTRRIAVPQNADAVFELMNSIRDSQTKGITAFRNKKDIVKKMMTDTEDGFSNILELSVNSVMAIDGSLGDLSIKNQTPRINDVKESLKNKGIIIEESELSQKAIYHKVFEYELSEEKTLEGRTALSLSNVEVGKSEAEGREEIPFPWYLKVKEGSEGGLIGEYVSEEELEVLDMLQNYTFKKGSDKPIGKEETSLVEDVSAKEGKIIDWDKENMNRELSELLNELSSLRSELKNSNLTFKDKSKFEKRIGQILNPKTKTESFKKIQEREALTASLDLSKKELSSFYSSVKRLQDAPFEGELSMYDADNSTRGLESRDLGLNLDNESQMPFEPNRLNGFQAFMARVDQLFANKYANVFSLQRAIEGAKKAVVDISQDFINAETLMYGKTANDLERLDDKVKAISEEMKANGLTSDKVSQYLIARHAAERNALIEERTEGKTVDGSGMSNERAQEVMDSFSPKEKAALDSVAKKVDAITKDTRQTMVKYGLESQETIDAFEDMFENYVPLGGLSADEMSADTSMYPTGGAGMSIYGDTTRRARGRKSEANNVLAQAIAQNAAVHAKARKNEALSSLYNLVEANPNTKVWRITKEVPFDAQSAVGVRIDGEQRFIVFTNPDHAKALKNMGVEKLDLISKGMRRFSSFLRRSFTTANPEFIISNFARDIQSALFNAMAEADIPGGQIQSKYIATKIIQTVKKTLPALLKDAVGKDMDPEMAAYFREFKEDGGQTGWGFVKDVGTIAAEIEAEVNEKSKAKKATEWMQKNSIGVIENVNDAFENSIRLAAYMEARKAGASRQKSAELAKNITVNFNRSGELGPMANAWYMFFNASVQGTVRLARSLGTLKDVRKPNGELESWYNRLNSAQKMAFGLSLTTGMLTAINIAMSDEDEDGVLFYNKIPDYEKERNLIIMYDRKNYLKIPLPYGFNVFANMGSAMAEAAAGHREPEDAGMFLLNSAFSSFSPISFGQSKDAAKYVAKGLTPTILKPMVDIAVNESYFGSSVYKDQFPIGAPKPESEMSFRAPEGVRGLFQWMNEATGGSEFVPGKVDFNPDKFWYGFEYYIGGAGQFVTRTMGTSKDLYETIKEGEKVPMKANDFPFLRKVYGEFSKYYDSDVYTENSNNVSQLYKEMKESDNKKSNRYKGIMKLESERKSTEKQIKRLRELRKEARDIKNYVERQNRIYELYEKERSLLMQFNKQYENLRGKD